MEGTIHIINRLMVDVFKDISKVEEHAIKSGAFDDLSITEMHTIEAVGIHAKAHMSAIAKKLNITVGTLTVAINNLVKKKYVERMKSPDDRRVVLIRLNNRGRVVYRMHEKFHQELIERAVAGLTPEEERVLAQALTKIHSFLLNVSFEGKESRRKS